MGVLKEIFVGDPIIEDGVFADMAIRNNKTVDSSEDHDDNSDDPLDDYSREEYDYSAVA